MKNHEVMNIITNIVPGNKSKRGRWQLLPAIVVALCALLSFTPLKPLALIGTVILAALYVPFPVRLHSFLLRLVLAFCLSAAFIQLSGVIFWMAQMAYTVQAAVILQLIFIALFALRKPWSELHVTFIDKADLVALGVTALTVLIIAFGALQRPLFPNLLRDSTTAFDDTIHTSLSATVYDQSGYVYGNTTHVIGRVVYQALVAYPQGWYLSNSVWWHSFSNNLSLQTSPRTFLLFYFISKLLWYGFIVFLFTRLLLYLVNRFESLSGWVEYLTVALLSFLGQMLLFLGIFKFGFSSFFPELLFTFALAFFVVELLDQRLTPLMRNMCLLYGLLLCGGLSMSWLLGAPAGYISLLLAFMFSFSGIRDLGEWIRQNFITVGAAIIVGLLGMAQVYVQVSYSVNYNLLNTDGGIWAINLLAFLLLLIVTLLIYSRLSRLSSVYRSFIVLFAPTAVMAGLIYVYQFLTAGKATYYSTKMAYVPFMIVMVFGFAGLVSFVSWYRLREGSFISVLLIVSVLAVIPYIFNMDLQLLNYARGKARKLSPYTASQLADLINRKEASHDNVVVFKGLDYEEDVITTNYLGMLSREQTSCQSEITWEQITGQKDNLIQTIQHCAGTDSNHPFYVFASATTMPQLSQVFSGSPTVKLILTN